MERCPKNNEKILFGNGFDYMIIKRGFDEKIMPDIAKNCGAKSVKDSINYLRIPFIGGGKVLFAKL